MTTWQGAAMMPRLNDRVMKRSSGALGAVVAIIDDGWVKVDWDGMAGIGGPPLPVRIDELVNLSSVTVIMEQP